MKMAEAVEAYFRLDDPTAKRLSYAPVRDVFLNHSKPPGTPQDVNHLGRRCVRLYRQFAHDP
jgi:hypothetical protein